jgi:hypothetical protein
MKTNVIIISLFLTTLTALASGPTFSRSEINSFLEKLEAESPYYFDEEKFNNIKTFVDQEKKKERGVIAELFSLNYSSISTDMGVYALKHRKLKKKLDQKSCSPIDHRGPKMGETRNQGSIGWCFAYASADLISHELGQRVSARDVAQQFHSIEGFDDAKAFTKGGFLDKAINTSLKNGVCTEADFPSDNERYYSANSKTIMLKEVFVELEKLKDSYQNRETKGTAKKYVPFIYHGLVDFVYSDETEVKESPLCDSYYLINKIFPNTSLDTVKEIIRTSSYEDYVKILFKSQCPKEKKITSNLRVKTKQFGRDAGIDQQLKSLEDIDNILKDRPVAIGYDGKMIMQKDNVFKKVSHASTIVGRKRNANGNCQYLVRNTWGRTYKRGPNDESGHIWVSPNELLSNIKRYSHF